MTKCEIVDDQSSGLPILVDKSVINVYVQDIIDVQAELKKLEASISKLQKEKTNLESRLSNQGFISKASAEIIDEHKARLTEVSEKINKSLLLQSEIGKMVQ